MAMRFQIVVFWAVTPCGDITIFTVKKMEAGRSSVTLASNHHTTRRNNLGNHKFPKHIEFVRFLT